MFSNHRFAAIQGKLGENGNEVRHLPRKKRSSEEGNTRLQYSRAHWRMIKKKMELWK
jgi:hypothetical protein